MTGEVTERFNFITLFGMALFRQKAIEFFTKFIINLYAVAIRGHPYADFLLLFVRES